LKEELVNLGGDLSLAEMRVDLLVALKEFLFR